MKNILLLFISCLYCLISFTFASAQEIYSGQVRKFDLSTKTRTLELSYIHNTDVKEFYYDFTVVTDDNYNTVPDPPVRKKEISPVNQQFTFRRKAMIYVYRVNWFSSKLVGTIRVDNSNNLQEYTTVRLNDDKVTFDVIYRIATEDPLKERFHNDIQVELNKQLWEKTMNGPFWKPD